MTSIATETQLLLKNLKNNYDESSDYMSEDDEEEVKNINQKENQANLESPDQKTGVIFMEDKLGDEAIEDEEILTEKIGV